MSFDFTDKIPPVKKFTLTDEGYLEGFAVISRTGIQDYNASELDLDGDGIISVYRDLKEVFKTNTLQSFSKIPITNNHPKVFVTAESWRDEAVGITGEEVLRDGETLRIGLKITDAAMIKQVQNGKKQLSVGYRSGIKWGDGVTPDGKPYQARQTKIIANHIAIVDSARAGPIAAINYGDQKMSDEKLTSVAIGDKAINVSVDAVPAIESFKTDQAKLFSDAATAHKTALDAKDTELAKRDAEIVDLKKNVLDDAALDARVAVRAKLVDAAGKIVKDFKTDGLSDDAIRKAVVISVLGDAVITGQGDAYINARFDVLAEDAAKDPGFNDPVAAQLRAANAGGGFKKPQTMDELYNERDQKIMDAWKPQVVTNA